MGEIILKYLTLILGEEKAKEGYRNIVEANIKRIEKIYSGLPELLLALYLEIGSKEEGKRGLILGKFFVIRIRRMRKVWKIL